MSPYQYRCGRCRASTVPAASRAEAEALRAHHRATKHGGLIPDGEDLRRVHGPSARDPDARYVSTRALLLGLGALALATAIARALGH